MENKITTDSAYLSLVCLLGEQQNEFSRRTGFGFGFNAWIRSADIRDDLGISYAQVRKLLKPLVEKDLVRKISKSGCYDLYSTTGWEDCVVMGDYFIEKED